MKGYGNSVKDAALNYVKNNGDRLSVVALTTMPSYAQATSGSTCLAIQTISAADYGSITDGGGGRQMQVNAQNDITIAASGDGQEICISDSGNTEVLVCTDAAAVKALSAGEKVSVAAWNVIAKNAA